MIDTAYMTAGASQGLRPILADHGPRLGFELSGLSPADRPVATESCPPAGERDFTSTLEHMLSLGMLPELLDAILPRMPLMYGQRTPDAVIQREGFRGMNLLRHELATIRDTGLGFYSFMFRRMYGPPSDRVTILPMEQIREQLPSFLESAGVVVTAEMPAYLVSAEALNRSEHDDYRSYYPPRLQDMVAARDQELLSRFNYAFDPPAESYSRLQSVA